MKLGVVVLAPHPDDEVFVHDFERIRAARARLYEKWRQIWSGEEIDDLVRHQTAGAQAMRQELADLRREVPERDRALVDRDREISDRREEISALAARIEESIRERDAAIGELNRRLREREAELGARDDALAAIYRSRRWTWTAPLRRTMERLRRAGG